MLNVGPDREKALDEMQRVARPQATVAFYVWDYPGGGVGFMRAFWDAAVSLDPAAADLTEVRRFPCCTREGLTALAQRAGLSAVESTAPEVPARAGERRVGEAGGEQCRVRGGRDYLHKKKYTQVDNTTRR